MEEEFTRVVEDGLKLSKRVVLPGGTPPPRPPAGMDRYAGLDAASLLPPVPMAYAVVTDPGAVDSPDVPSYQPHVYGCLNPPALIPLQMREVDLRDLGRPLLAALCVVVLFAVRSEFHGLEKFSEGKAEVTAEMASFFGAKPEAAVLPEALDASMEPSLAQTAASERDRSPPSPPPPSSATSPLAVVCSFWKGDGWQEPAAKHAALLPTIVLPSE